MTGAINPRMVWNAGFVRRWHQNPALSWLDDYDAAHQGRCAALVIALWPDHSHDLLKAAITHDMGELIVGDLSTDTKSADGALPKVHAHAEWSALEKMGLRIDLSLLDRRRLKLVDRLDAYLLVCLRAPWVLRGMDWELARESLILEAGALGVGRLVLSVLNDG